MHSRYWKASKNSQATLTRPKIAAIVLAAGQSRRAGGQNKLLAELGDAPMINHVVRSAVESDACQVIVVTGHEAELVQKSLENYRAEIVFNPDYVSGMASSLRIGIQAVAREMDGALILLGDMPLVGNAQINQLITEFDPATERDIVVPYKDGRRGNPVLWSARYFPALKALTGDTGGRGLIIENIANVRDVPVIDDAVFTDFDTTDSLSYLHGLKESR
ncbi:MAG: nucleotidyltransferase family protein [Gammaproteobacteria bacterium]|nr:nucleotidyltransferase family protein [Gammaproteobacteria bacterium]